MAKEKLLVIFNFEDKKFEDTPPVEAVVANIEEAIFALNPTTILSMDDADLGRLVKSQIQ